MNYSNGMRRRIHYDEHNLLSGYETYSPSGDLLTGVSMSQTWNGKVVMTIQPDNKTMELVYNTRGDAVFARQEGGLPLILEESPGRQKLLFGDEVSDILKISRHTVTLL